MQEYKNRKAQLRRDLKEARSAISISFDLWTSPNAHAVLGVVAYFIDRRGRRRQAAIEGFQEDPVEDSEVEVIDEDEAVKEASEES